MSSKEIYREKFLRKFLAPTAIYFRDSDEYDEVESRALQYNARCELEALVLSRQMGEAESQRQAERERERTLRIIREEGAFAPRTEDASYALARAINGILQEKPERKEPGFTVRFLKALFSK